jgi:hypothetical protein
VLQSVRGRVYKLESGMPRFALGGATPENLHKAAGFAGLCVSRNGCGSSRLLDARSCGRLDGWCFSGRYTFRVVEMTIGRATMVSNSSYPV